MQVRPEKLLSVQDSGIDYGGWGDNSVGIQCILAAVSAVCQEKFR